MISAVIMKNGIHNPIRYYFIILFVCLMNRPVSYQIWLNAGSPRWWERIYGQITNDYILSQDWKMGDLWDASVYEKNDENMHRLVLSLLSRCRKQVRVYTSGRLSRTRSKIKLLYVFELSIV